MRAGSAQRSDRSIPRLPSTRAGRAVRVDHDEPLAFYLVRKQSVSSNKMHAAGWQWRIYRDVEHMGMLQACWYMLLYVWNALAKRR